MLWSKRVGGGGERESRGAAEAVASVEVLERTSPGLGALFGALRADGGHSILDFGPATGEQLAVLGRYARQIRFAGLVPDAPEGGAWAEAFRSIPPNPGRPYDVVLAWDIFDRVDRSEHPSLMARLVELTPPGARLYAVVDASGASEYQPVRTTLLDTNRVSQQPVGPSRPASPSLLPAQMERALAPFEVVHAFSLRTGFREYVGLRR